MTPRRELGGPPGSANWELSLAGSAEPFEQVIDHLRDRHMLLVLDNFEQLIKATAASLDRLLQAMRAM